MVPVLNSSVNERITAQGRGWNQVRVADYKTARATLTMIRDEQLAKVVVIAVTPRLVWVDSVSCDLVIR